jgi:non-canonical (house-cleaning) NTP pyrophosphatase
MREVAAFDYLVGIEGGITKRSAQTEAFAWVYIADKYLRTSYSRTATFLLPTKITDLLDKGYELGEANDRVFNTHNSKQNNGAIGLLTQDRISRTNLYQPAVTMAMIPFLPENKCLYK